MTDSRRTVLLLAFVIIITMIAVASCQMDGVDPRSQPLCCAYPITQEPKP